MKRKTISTGELNLLVAKESREIPEFIEVNGVRKQWTTQGWKDVGKANGTEVLVVSQ
jgi:hypothetical protein